MFSHHLLSPAVLNVTSKLLLKDTQPSGADLKLYDRLKGTGFNPTARSIPVVEGHHCIQLLNNTQMHMCFLLGKEAGYKCCRFKETKMLYYNIAV